MRLDLTLSLRENISRNKAAELITSGAITVNGILRKKPSYTVCQTDAIVIKNGDRFVSRSAYKLSRFLDEIKIDINGLNCLDVGASAGGWTQVLLLEGAKNVTAIDAGTDQLSPILRSDPRVQSKERTDIRFFKTETLFDLVVCDVSFISLEKIVAAIDNLAKDKIIALFKPQFEVGRAAQRAKNGVVRDEKAIVKALEHFENETKKLKWILRSKAPSSLKGKAGNLEYLFYYEKPPK
ncbi:MAG: TlyA family RNA methyltransferase [Helicobacteraceae bacterium]|jgi:23S rRNA (cytidine1920-2'-O)/16S rRNA (cytidine1409-2'-O)-methyltransferase|nr:TlyA family RNA methyltransferase [Helicobacteraceae bacterium]